MLGKKVLPLARKVEINEVGLPTLCYSWDPATCMAVQINYGEDGYIPTHWPPYYEHETYLIDELNSRLGVSREIRAAMEIYSMTGEWPTSEKELRSHVKIKKAKVQNK